MVEQLPHKRMCPSWNVYAVLVKLCDPMISTLNIFLPFKWAEEKNTDM